MRISPFVSCMDVCMNVCVEGQSRVPSAPDPPVHLCHQLQILLFICASCLWLIMHCEMMQGLLCAEGQLEKNIMAADATGGLYLSCEEALYVSGYFELVL